VIGIVVGRGGWEKQKGAEVFVEARRAETVMHGEESCDLKPRQPDRSRFEGSISHRGGSHVENQGIQSVA
jgi:hypothetical protein